MIQLKRINHKHTHACAHTRTVDAPALPHLEIVSHSHFTTCYVGTEVFKHTSEGDEWREGGELAETHQAGHTGHLHLYPRLHLHLHLHPHLRVPEGGVAHCS